jgi:4-hydroxy-3-methylbut-2-en-1-yl diphosphate reductase
MNMQVNIDQKSGFCFGVINAISIAEKYLDQHGSLFCLGDIVHNNKEIERLREKGLIIINHDDMKQLYNTRVLIRAHGEPPQTYSLALNNNIEIIDASCPVVLKLQSRIKKGFNDVMENQGQVIIFGKPGHAEVVGLLGQTQGKAIVVNELSDLDMIDFAKPINLYSQTTQSIEGFHSLVTEIKNRIHNHACKENPEHFKPFDTICRQVANRGPHLAKFASEHDVIIFVSGKKSSNGMYLHNICKQNNPNSYMISDTDEIQQEWVTGASNIGICGATSTPKWLMEKVKHYLEENLK